jgi:GNAT superfamily N-acetyltransferase
MKSYEKNNLSPSSLSVRQALLGDERRIAKIHVAAWREAYKSFMDEKYLESLNIDEKETMWASILKESGKGTYLVSELNHKIEGFCAFGSTRDSDLDELSAELFAINISPKKWRKGLGTALLSRVIEEVSHKNYSTIHLWVIERNAQAIQFYKQHGFKCENIYKVDSSHSENPIKEVRYVKLLG